MSAWSTLPDKFNDVEQSQSLDSFRYAGPLRIPPENFQLRARYEVNTKDAVNARMVETWAASVPKQQSDYYRADLAGGGMITAMAKRQKAGWARAGVPITVTGGPWKDKVGVIVETSDDGLKATVDLGGLQSLQRVDVANLKSQTGEEDKHRGDSQVPESLRAVAYDMAPQSSRTDRRDFRQSRPFDPSGPALALNPYFDRYDPTRDPRNAVRELNSVVYELKSPDRGLTESERIRERSFQNRTSPANEGVVRVAQAYELMRPKIDNPEVVYRSQSSLWKLGSPLNSTNGAAASQPGQ